MVALVLVGFAQRLVLNWNCPGPAVLGSDTVHDSATATAAAGVDCVEALEFFTAGFLVMLKYAIRPPPVARMIRKVRIVGRGRRDAAPLRRRAGGGSKGRAAAPAEPAAAATAAGAGAGGATAAGA